jgi:hypothetical protein
MNKIQKPSNSDICFSHCLNTVHIVRERFQVPVPFTVQVLKLSGACYIGINDVEKDYDIGSRSLPSGVVSSVIVLIFYEKLMIITGDRKMWHQ